MANRQDGPLVGARTGRAAAAFGLALLLGACSVDMGGFAFTNEKSAVAHVGTSVPMLGPDGRCEADVSINPSSVGGAAREVTLGMSECALVALKGKPDDVLIGGSGKGEREVQVLYQEPGGKRLYLFTDNKLTKIVD